MIAKDIFDSNHSLMTVPKLETYIIDQRESRYQLLLRKHAAVKVLADCVDDGKPVDGAYLTIRSFLKTESLTRGNFGQAKNAVEFLENKRSKLVSPHLQQLRKCKGALIRNNDVLDWKANELSFYSNMCKGMKPRRPVSW